MTYCHTRTDTLILCPSSYDSQLRLYSSTTEMIHPSTLFSAFVESLAIKEFVKWQRGHISIQSAQLHDKRGHQLGHFSKAVFPTFSQDMLTKQIKMFSRSHFVVNLNLPNRLWLCTVSPLKLSCSLIRGIDKPPNLLFMELGPFRIHLKTPTLLFRALISRRAIKQT